MTKNEIEAVINRLRGAFLNGDSLNDQIKNTEYAKSLAMLDFIQLEALIDKLKLSYKFLPSIAEIAEEYRLASKQINTVMENVNNCLLCDNNGFILHTNKTDPKAMKLGYKCIYSCICDKGLAWNNALSINTLYSHQELENIKAKRIFRKNKLSNDERKKIIACCKEIIKKVIRK